MNKQLKERIAKEWGMLDPVDPLRDLLSDVFDALEQKPVALRWQQAPIRTAWGDDMVVANVAIDNDHTLSLYCERDQTPKIDAMFAHPQQEPVAWMHEWEDGERIPLMYASDSRDNDEPVSVRPLVYGDTPKAQRPWVGLTDAEMQALWDRYAHMEMMRAIEAKLKEKNT